MPKLPFKFWNRHPSIVAAELIGHTLTRLLEDGSRLSGRIIETEAYHHSEAACHAYRFENRERSDRVAHFFGPAGVTYVYLNYGIHHLLNVITGPDEDGSAVLIRAIEPKSGIDRMRLNRGNVRDKNLCNGPGKLTSALSIDLSHNKVKLHRGEDQIAFSRPNLDAIVELSAGPRVGISKATDLPWRFAERDNPNISKAKENRLLVPISSP
ncbi:DNA-3-methyladenine glycosylase [Mariniblastus fucicola]|nr:DNA-3-methyladenine glycosylase [Mariniblastus fucicola]